MTVPVIGTVTDGELARSVLPMPKLPPMTAPAAAPDKPMDGVPPISGHAGSRSIPRPKRLRLPRENLSSSEPTHLIPTASGGGDCARSAVNAPRSKLAKAVARLPTQVIKPWIEVITLPIPVEKLSSVS